MAEKVTIDIDAVINTGDSLAKLRALKKAQKEVVAGSAEFNQLAGAIRDTGDALDGAKLGADDLAGALEAAPGPVGQLFQGLKKVELATKSFGGALKATGIGLVVSLVGMLVAAFAKTEGSMKALEPVMIMLEKAMGGLVQAFTPFLEMFADLVIQILPFAIKGISTFYGGLVSLFTLVKEVGVGAAKILAGIFTQDYKLAAEGFEQVKNSIGKTKEAFNEFQDNFDKGFANQSETEKKLAEEQDARNKAAQEARDKAEEERKKAFEERLKQMDAEDKMDEALMKKQKAELLAFATTEQEKFDIERKFADLAHQARIQDLDDRMALYNKDSLEYKGLQTEKINVEADYITTQKGFLDTFNKMQDEANAKVLEENKKLDQEKRNIKLGELQAQIELLDRENQLLDNDFALDLERLAAQRLILDQLEALELQNQDLTEFQKTEITKKYSDQRNKLTEGEVAVERASVEAKTALLMQYAELAGQFGQVLAQAAGENKKLAIAGLIIEQAAGVAKIAIATQVAAAKAGYLTPAGIATLAAGALSVVSAVIATKRGIQQINAQRIPGSSGGGGGGSVGTTPTFSAPGGMAAPQIQTQVGETPGSQIAQTIGTAQQRPIVAQVVSQAVSSQQALDRRNNRAATFSTGG